MVASPAHRQSSSSGSRSSNSGCRMLRNVRLTTVLVVVFVILTITSQVSFFSLFNETGSSSTARLAASMIGTATSGRRCTLIKSRTFDRQKILYKDTTTASAAVESRPDILAEFMVNKTCRYWATLTTIFKPTEAAWTLPADWCLVVAADRKGPTEYDMQASSSSSSSPSGAGPFTALLSVEKQQALAKQFDFVNQLPWNHFARKNVAYLFAILNQAEWIWDFDDDNILYGLPPDFSSNDMHSTTSSSHGVYFEPRNKSACGAMNPYPWFDAYPQTRGLPPNATFWPRGYPLELIQSSSCEAVSKCFVPGAPAKIGIYQAIANGDPDVDAIYRLTGKLPIHFPKGTKEAPILVPNGTLSPMNAQAALVHVARASWSLFLPTTVHGRVSDIWRSYITQTVGRFYGLQTAFLPDPLVRQERNAHDYLADFNAEIPMYECAGALVDILNSWQAPQNSSLPMALLELYIDLYEYEVVEARDVDLIQHWLQSLKRVGYTFPDWNDRSGLVHSDGATCSPYTRQYPVPTPAPVTDAPAPPTSHIKINALPTTGKRSKNYFTDVALVGQFNYEQDPEHVAHWVRRWSEVFRVVSVWGPFTDATYHNLTNRGIDVVLYKGDAGFYSPVRNLGRSLMRYANDPTIQGVMMTHDDLLMNLPGLVQQGFPDDGNIVMTGSEDRELKTYRFTNNSMFWDEKTGSFLNMSEYTTLWTHSWHWWNYTLLTFSEAVSNDTRSAAFSDENGVATMYLPTSSDFAYVPTKYARTFHDMAEWLADHKVFLEASMATAVHYLRDHYNASITYMTTCTDWEGNRPFPLSFVNACRQWNRPLEVYHPIKISNSTEIFDILFDTIIQ